MLVSRFSGEMKWIFSFGLKYGISEHVALSQNQSRDGTGEGRAEGLRDELVLLAAAAAD